MAVQQAQPQPVKRNGANTSKNKMSGSTPNSQQGIPQQEIKQNSGVSASMALQATQKAWDLRQAANAAGDPNAREEILAKAINKEIEAESFGKAAKYTRSGAFQGLAAGAGLGVQPGVTLGKVTGALVGGTVSTATGLLGGGVGSVYGAMNGPFWDLGEMASHGVRSIVGDFPNWKSTPAQKKALEKMTMQTRETQAPTKEELEQMKSDAPDEMSPSWSQFATDMSSWRPSMPSMPKGATQGLAGLGAGLGASMPSWGGQGKNQNQRRDPDQPQQRTQGQNQQSSQARGQQSKPSSRQPPKQAGQIPREAPKPKEASTPKEAPKLDKPRSQKASTSEKSSKPQVTPKPTASTSRSQASPSKEVSKPQAASKPPASRQPNQASPGDNKENKSPTAADRERRKPRKLATQSNKAKSSGVSAPKKAPRKLESRKAAA